MRLERDQLPQQTWKLYSSFLLKSLGSREVTRSGVHPYMYKMTWKRRLAARKSVCGLVRDDENLDSYFVSPAENGVKMAEVHRVIMSMTCLRRQSLD